MKENSNYKWKVCVRCFTFNHAHYITDALNGFTMQQTTFPFVCAIVDDASTDGEQEVLRKYFYDNFDVDNKSVYRNEETADYYLTFAQHKTNKNCFFAVLYLKYNHYSIGKPKNPYLQKWHVESEYSAGCEGDDFWIDAHKLVCQIDILEKDPQCTMVYCRTKRLSVAQNSFLEDNCCYSESTYARAEDIILKGGLFVSFCSVVYRNGVKDNYPNYCVKCHVGDYPLVIMCAMKGKVYYINTPMAVYRTENSKSWVGRQKEPKLSEKRLNGIESEVKMLEGFKNDYPAYSVFFHNRIKRFIFSNLPNKRKDMDGYRMYCVKFKNIINQFDLKYRIIVLSPYYFPYLYKLYSFIRK